MSIHFGSSHLSVRGAVSASDNTIMSPPALEFIKSIDPSGSNVYTDQNFKSMFKTYDAAISNSETRLGAWAVKLYDAFLGQKNASASNTSPQLANIDASRRASVVETPEIKKEPPEMTTEARTASQMPTITEVPRPVEPTQEAGKVDMIASPPFETSQIKSSELFATNPTPAQTVQPNGRDSMADVASIESAASLRNPYKPDLRKSSITASMGSGRRGGFSEPADTTAANPYAPDFSNIIADKNEPLPAVSSSQENPPAQASSLSPVPETPTDALPKSEETPVLPETQTNNPIQDTLNPQVEEKALPEEAETTQGKPVQPESDTSNPVL